MYSEKFEPRANFTDENALKVLLRLIEEYVPKQDETGYFPWEKASETLQEHPERIASVAEAANEVLHAIIELKLQETDQRLDTSRGIEHIIAKGKAAPKSDTTIEAPQLSELFSLPIKMSTARNEETEELKRLRVKQYNDLRSLERAVTKLTKPEEPMFEAYDALMAIVKLG